MKKIIIISLLLFSVLGCKKKEAFAPEGPTDIRIRNLSELVLHDVVLSSSENTLDIDNIGDIDKGGTSDYFRFTKAYPKAEISAKIDVGGSLITFTTGKVDYTYMQYIGQERITFEVYISNMSTKELTINNVIMEEPLVLK